MYSLNKTKIEDFTELELNHIESLIRQSCDMADITAYEILIVGSVVFGLDEINDIDVVVYGGDVNKAHSKKLRSEFNKICDLPIDLTCEPRTSVNERPSCDLGLLIPYYDLKRRKLMNKKPYDVVPLNFSYVRNEDGTRDISRMVTYNRIKQHRITSLKELNYRK